MRLKIFILLFMFWLSGCSDFLEEKSQSEIRPSTVRDMEKLLKGEAYFNKSEGLLFNQGTDLFTDDICSNGQLPEEVYEIEREKYRYRFSWDKAMFDDNGGGEDISFWQVPYSRIKGCNVILEYIGQMDGDEKEREYIRGEAYTLRGFYYLMLVNFFGLPYNYGDPSKNLAIPLKLISGVTDEKLKRSSVAACYKQIEQDLLQGAELMKNNIPDRYMNYTRLSHLAAYGLLSRMYLYMEDWDNALKYAELVLEEKSGLLDLKNARSGGVYYSTTPVEIIWGGGADIFGSATGGKRPFSVSSELVDVFALDVDNGVVDVRGDYLGSNAAAASYLKWSEQWVYNGGNPYFVYWVSCVLKSDNATINGNLSRLNGGIRTAEMYLNQAEAYIRRYMESGNSEDAVAAIRNLNELRRNRFDAGYVEKKTDDFQNGEELFSFYERERRRELCGESNHRWFDLRRFGMPEIKHIFRNKDNTESRYMLSKEDPRYVLPIPAKVVERNYNLIID